MVTQEIHKLIVGALHVLLLSRAISRKMLFCSFFKSLVGKEVVVELRNNQKIRGTLHSVDQFHNIRLTDIAVAELEKYPHMLNVRTSFIRGSVVRYIHLPEQEVDTHLLHDATRHDYEARAKAGGK